MSQNQFQQAQPLSGLMRDISEESRLLAESERLGKALLSSISHEIRTPLTAIQTAADNLVKYGDSDLSEFQKEMVAEIQEAGERLNRFIGKVLDMTRLESGRLKPRFDVYDIHELVMMAEKETRKELTHHKVTIDIAPELPLVEMDFDLMLHALTNLLSNAAFHTPSGTEVTVSVEIEDGAVLIIVSDRGPGIPAESLPHLFEKFYRAPASRAGGTGLGLCLVQGFVEAQGGRVTAANRALGGAAFAIHLRAPRAWICEELCNLA